MDNKQVYQKRNFYNNDDSGKVNIFALLLPYILSFILGIIVQIAVNGNKDSYNAVIQTPWFLVVTALLTQGAFLLIFVLYSKAFHISFKASNIHKKFSWQDLLVSIFVALVFLFGSWLFFNCQAVFLNDVLQFKPQAIGFPTDNVWWLLLSIVVQGMLPAFCEDLIFRGVILQGFRKNFSDKIAIIFSAAMFALMHGNIAQLIYPFLLGLVLGWIVVRTGSLWLSMIIHFVNNAIVLIFNHFSIDIAPFANVWWYYILAFVTLALTFVIIYLLDKFYFKRKNKNDQLQKELLYKPSIFVWVGIVISVILLVLSTVLTYTTPATV